TYTIKNSGKNTINGLWFYIQDEFGNEVGQDSLGQETEPGDIIEGEVDLKDGDRVLISPINEDGRICKNQGSNLIAKNCQ
ncbi:hypothetical protein ACFL0W_05630, partial [Nanoarchaeota archaeon]